MFKSVPCLNNVINHKAAKPCVPKLDLSIVALIFQDILALTNSRSRKAFILRKILFHNPCYKIWSLPEYASSKFNDTSFKIANQLISLFQNLFPTTALVALIGFKSNMIGNKNVRMWMFNDTARINAL